MVQTLEKPFRIDVRLTKSQRANYERAATLRGQTLTQWATLHLDESARRDIDDATTTTLSPDAFEDFCELLEKPLPESAQQLLERKAVWE